MNREDIFIPEHKTNVLPLRWLANYIFHPISMLFFRIALKANDQLEYDYCESNLFDEIKEKVGFKLYYLFDKPYTKWGTYYRFQDGFLGDLGGSGWDDYDENGIPYWDYFWNEDPITGDAWRLLPNKEKLHEILNTPAPWEDVRDGSIIPEIQKELDSGTSN